MAAQEDVALLERVQSSSVAPRNHSSVRLERDPDKVDVLGSNPSGSTMMKVQNLVGFEVVFDQETAWVNQWWKDRKGLIVGIKHYSTHPPRDRVQVRIYPDSNAHHSPEGQVVTTDPIHFRCLMPEVEIL